jgi:hypothetical protein
MTTSPLVSTVHGETFSPMPTDQYPSWIAFDLDLSSDSKSARDQRMEYARDYSARSTVWPDNEPSQSVVIERLTIVPVESASSDMSKAPDTELYRWTGDVTFHHRSCEDTQCCGADTDKGDQMDGLKSKDLESSLCGDPQRRDCAMSRRSSPQTLVASLASEVDRGVWKLICSRPGRNKLSVSVMYSRGGRNAPVEGRRWSVHHTNTTTPIVEDSEGALAYV